MVNDSMQDASERDLATLQGQWEQVGFEANDLSDLPDEHGGTGAITTIDGRWFIVRTVTGELLLEGAFMLDGTLDPKAITWVDSIGADAGKHLPASYVLSGDRFMFIAADEGDPRPVVFRTGPGQVMRTFMRRS